jgi:hypothetical protein
MEQVPGVSRAVFDPTLAIYPTLAIFSKVNTDFISTTH